MANNFYLLANWKMSQTLNGALSFVRELNLPRQPEGFYTAIFPSYIHIADCMKETNRAGLQWGAQDCSTEKEGAFTAEISAAQLAELGVHYVLVGHSERRQRVLESSQSLEKKLSRVLEAGLEPIYCVGESLEQRKAGRVEETLEEQLRVLRGLSKKPILAYEPVWAIGTGLVAGQDEIQAAHRFLRDYGAAVLYGGSVKPQNVEEILAVEEVDGLLVGGASLKQDSFLKLWEKSQQVFLKRMGRAHG